MRCPSCDFESPPGSRFCGTCGAHLPQVCPDCGFANPPDHRFCSQCGTRLDEEPDPAQPSQSSLAQPSPSLVQLKGERRLATIILADIKGSTALGERMSTEDFIEILNQVFQILESEIYRLGGEIDQFRGDCVVAFFGAKVAHEDDPERAVLAALAMQEAMKTYAAELAEREGIELLLRVGVNTGEVIAARIGDSRLYSEDTAMGQAVALANRLETAAEPGSVLVSESTYRLVEPLFEWESLGEITVKGVSQPVAVYRPLAAKVIPGKVRGIRGLASPLVGREEEFRALQEAVERLQAGVGGIITLVGEAGLGKSRLVAELRKYVNQQFSKSAGLHWVEGRCLSYGASIAYLLWLDVLRGLLEVTVEAPPDIVRNVLREQVEGLCPEHFEDIYPYLGRLMSLPMEAEAEAAVRDLDGETLKASTFRAVEGLIECAAQQQPLVVVCEDLHWADPTSLELLEQMLGLTDYVPMLLVGVLRPEREHGCWHIKETATREHRHRYTDLCLDPLSAIESETLVGNLLQVEDLPQELRESILDHAEGNPFYVEEIIRSLIDDGAIARDDSTGRWAATRDVADVTIPDTLHGVLMARIDRLQEETKRILQLASIIGRIFLYCVLAEIAQEERGLDKHLLTLQREEMIRERARLPELEYIFKHELTREAAYNSLLKRERRIFHRQVAEALEQLLPDRIEEQVGLLAHHWERAEEPEKATKYLSRAGDQARLAYAHQEAIDYYQRALALLKEQQEHERAARTLMKLGLTYHQTFDFRSARQAYEKGFALWQKAGATAEEAALSPAPRPLRVDWPYMPQTLDPSLAEDSDTIGVVHQLFSGLVDLGPEMNILPDLAHSWEILEEGRKYVFYLRDDLYWSDGTSVTAADFEYAWKRLLSPTSESLVAGLLYDVKGAQSFHQGKSSNPDDVGVRALDDFTLIVELEQPTGYFLYLMANNVSYPVPRHVVETHGQAWTKAQNLVTNGPYRLESWNQESDKDGELILSRNPKYHGRFTGNVQQVELRVRPDVSARLSAYEAGDLDTLSFRDLSQERDWVRQQYAGDYLSAPFLATSFIGFDVNRAPFDDPKVRQAFVMAVNRKQYADVNLKGLGFPATGGFIPPGMQAHSAGIGLPYDPGQALRLLAQAGYPAGDRFPEVEFASDRCLSQLADYLITQWEVNLGVAVVWKAMGWDAFYVRLETALPHIFFNIWVGDYPDPDSFLRTCNAIRWIRWWDETYQQLVENARRVVDQQTRTEMYRQADEMLVGAAILMPFEYLRSHLLVRPEVKKFPTSAAGWWYWKDVIIDPY